MSLAVVFLMWGASVTAFAWREGEIYSTPNTRTVLFEKGDLKRPCWGIHDVGVLLNRYVMQALLPRELPTDLEAFLEYATLCTLSVDQGTSSRLGKEVVANALADALGGYLQMYALPAAKIAYYEGNANVTTCQRLYDLENDFKTVLKTDGGGWAGPVVIKSYRRPKPLCVKRVRNACDQIIFSRTKKRKPKKGEASSDNRTCHDLGGYQIPLPFFDDCKRPNAIAVPFKNCSLYSLRNIASEGVLIKYYETSVSCINQQCSKNKNSNCKQVKEKFERKYYGFLKRYVAPRLQDVTWYPAFYKAVPLMDAIRRSAPAYEAMESQTSQGCGSSRNAFYSIAASPMFILFLVLFFISLLCLGCVYCMSRSSKVETDCDSSAAKSYQTIGPDGKPICVYCNCDSKAKASFTAKFYCRKKPNQSCDEGNCACAASCETCGCCSRTNVTSVDCKQKNISPCDSSN